MVKCIDCKHYRAPLEGIERPWYMKPYGNCVWEVNRRKVPLWFYKHREVATPNEEHGCKAFKEKS